jgi:hypothetical protein
MRVQLRYACTQGGCRRGRVRAHVCGVAEARLPHAYRTHAGLTADGYAAPPAANGSAGAAAAASAGVGIGASPAARRVLFDVSAAGKHVPRALFVDIEARARARPLQRETPRACMR